jgi:sugar phosphate isomerase/epimerase
LLKKVISFVSYFDPIFLIFYIRGDSEPLHFSEFISHKKIKNVEDAIEKASHESLKILTREARKRNVQLAMENSGKGKFSTADDFIPYLKYEEFNLCYDIGHSIRSSSSRDVYKIIEKWCKKFEKYIITSHIHDVKINREVIDHLNIGEGDLNFKEISNLLSITTCNYIKLETFSAYSSNSLLRKNLKEIKNAFKIFP